MVYTPYICNISDITRGESTSVTTSIPHGFVIGNEIQFFIPQNYGITQLNKRKGYVTAITSDTVTVDINSIGFNAYVTPSLPPYVVIDPAQIAPIGDANTGYLSPGGIPPRDQYIPGAFAP